ncbi:flavoprotein [Saccharothrix longispora]|uniref:Phosphopantothenoylcysteine synthetase/decarboxylase n=1 Tax=Saccharothrix longispora TaxID=33920 RepID=A0ABU1PP93_9PSEU|nr:flavoprotein [Saccharothrix longispora]MDR6592490.1 phosphopantothenoylcysteine synthetase/decarboxylase [Saccharothrix longispora]
MNGTARTVYLVVTAAPPVLSIDRLIESLHAADWRVCVIATPTAASWVNLDDLADRTGTPVRSQPGLPGQRDPLPRADALLVAPATFNTINKWAHGISDNLALGLLNELLATDVPILVVPCVKQLLRDHPAYTASVAALTAMHVAFMDPDQVTTRSPDGLATFHWKWITTTFDHFTSTSDETAHSAAQAEAT